MNIGKGDEDHTTSSWQAKIIGVTEPKLKLLVDPLFTKAILNNHSALGDSLERLDNYKYRMLHHTGNIYIRNCSKDVIMP